MTNKDIQTLESDYRDLAEAHGAATQRGDYKAANKSYGKLIAVLAKIRVKGKDGEASLLNLVRDQNESVPCWAATHSLPFAESSALAVLEALALRVGPIAFDAKMVVQQWKKGQLVIP